MTKEFEAVTDEETYSKQTAFTKLKLAKNREELLFLKEGYKYSRSTLFGALFFFLTGSNLICNFILCSIKHQYYDWYAFIYMQYCL